MRNQNLPKVFLIVLLLASQISFADLPCNVLVGYWQSSWGTSVRLKDINSSYNVINIAFLEAGGGDGAPDNNSVSALSFTTTNNANLLADIPVVQAQGKLVLMSIGGAMGSFKLSSTADINTFVSKVQTTIQTYGLDGIDIDLERSVYLQQISGGTVTSPESHISNMITAINTLLTWYQSTYGKKMILTMVPEVAYTLGGMSSYMSSTYGVAYLSMIESLKSNIDLVMVQLYNASGGSYGLDGTVYYEGTADFIVSQTEAIIKGFTCVNSKGTYSGIDASKVAVCLPASSAAASSGYTAPATVKSAIDYLMGKGTKPGTYTLKTTGGYPGLKGMATWSINTDLDGSYAYVTNYASIFGNCPATGVSEVKDVAFNIYPNPASDFLTVLMEEDKESILSVFDLSGKLMLSVYLNSTSTSLNISELPSGIYSFNVGSKYKKVVVQ